MGAALVGPPNALASDIRALRLWKSHAVEIVIPLPVSVYGSADPSGGAGNGRPTGPLFSSQPPSVPTWKRMFGGASASSRACGLTPSAVGRCEKNPFHTSWVLSCVLITLAAGASGSRTRISSGPGDGEGLGLGVGGGLGLGEGG